MTNQRIGFDVEPCVVLHTVNAHEGERAMGCDFHGPRRIVSGGTDGRLRLFKLEDSLTAT